MARAPRIGPRMMEAVAFVAHHEGCPILPVAEAVGPNGSRNYGYRTVHRAINAGLLDYTISSRTYALTVTDAGYRAIARGA